MGQPARFRIEGSNPDVMLLRDLGPWNRYYTITNDAERVVERVLPMLGQRRLFYYDSEGELTELLVKDGRFAGFKPAPQGVPKKALLAVPQIVWFFPNGNTAVCDSNGKQMPELQESWFLLYVKFLEEKGIDPEGIEFQLPHGKATVFKTSEGNYNWRF
ncbi:MAG TPA: hypothetical protein VND65_01825 [Candidatus Binatia bacterium]|nr:hypothetical protein [Candidatus Binatia bacterium]